MSNKVNKQLIVIGIAGGIGSGKSTVTDYLKDKGYSIYDADVEARNAVKPGEPALDKLKEYFGHEIISEDGTLNRRKLGQLAFASKEKSAKLNEILHHDISSRIDKKLNDQERHIFELSNIKMNDRIAFLSAPLFFEANLQDKCKETWVIVADQNIRIKRTINRDELTESEVTNRISRQMTDEQRIKLADQVLTNNGSKEDLLKQVDDLLKQKH